MHSRDYLQLDDFSFRREGAVRGALEVCGLSWSADDQVVIIAPDPVADLARVAGLILAWTYLFYRRPVARAPAFFGYPNHFIVGGQSHAEPRVLGPSSDAPWSAAWCRLDVWPSTHHAVAATDPATLMAAAFMLEPTILVWPARLSPPAAIHLPAGPDLATARRLMRARLREIWLYGDEQTPRARELWRLEYRHGAAALMHEALVRLPETAREVEPVNHVACVAPETFLT